MQHICNKSSAHCKKHHLLTRFSIAKNWWTQQMNIKREDLVVVECFINDVRWYKDYNDAWNEFFADVRFPPTRSTFQVGLLAPNMNIEMKIVAVKQK